MPDDDTPKTQDDIDRSLAQSKRITLTPTSDTIVPEDRHESRSTVDNQIVGNAPQESEDSSQVIEQNNQAPLQHGIAKPTKTSHATAWIVTCCMITLLLAAGALGAYYYFFIMD